jgi:hypothetical protein
VSWTSCVSIIAKFMLRVRLHLRTLASFTERNLIIKFLSCGATSQILHLYLVENFEAWQLMPSGFTCSEGGAANASHRPEVTFDTESLPVPSSSGAACRMKNGDHCSMLFAAKSLVALHSSDTIAEAVANEIRRASTARKILLSMIQVIDDEIVKPATAVSKKSCNSAANIASGLFPALVFEYLSLRQENDGSAMDPVIPCSSVFSDSIANSITKRMSPFVHDLLRCKGDAASKKCNEISKKILMALEHNTSVPTPPTPPILTSTEVIVKGVDDVSAAEISIVCGNYRHSLLKGHFLKLTRFYIGPHEELFSRLFILCQRYFVLTGSAENPAQEGGWHGSVPPHIMQLLSSHKDFNFGGECFASPFNASCAAYYSAFPDTDCFFGGVGSFFSGPAPTKGMFEANPPFEHSTVMAMTSRMISLLNASQEPLAFLIVLPWADKGRALGSTNLFREEVEKSGLLGPSVDLEGARTPFVDGYQQCSHNSAFTSRLDTRILLLHNHAHAAMHTKESVGRFLEAIVEKWSEGPKRSREVAL